MLLDAVARARAKLIDAPARLGDADDRHVQVAALHHRLQRREDFLVSQVARGAEKDECIGMRIVHECPFRPPISLRLFQVPAELKAHRGKQLVLDSPLRRARLNRW